MKIKKPSGYVGQISKSVEEFLINLPDEFEILGPGEVAVKWPNGLTRERILWLLAHPFSAHFGELHALAKIAPERKKRKVELWRHESWPSSMPPHAQISGASMFSDGVGNWRKVGECEIEE